MLETVTPSNSNDQLISNLCFLVTFLLALQSSMTTNQSGKNHRGNSLERPSSSAAGGGQSPGGTFLCPSPREGGSGAAAGTEPPANSDSRILEVVAALSLDELEADMEARINEILPAPIPPPPPPQQPFDLQAAARELYSPLPAKRSFSEICGVQEEDDEEAWRRDRLTRNLSGRVQGVHNDGGNEIVRLFGSTISVGGGGVGGSANEIRLFGKRIVIGLPAAVTPPSGDPSASIIINADKEDAAAPADSVAGGLADAGGDDNKDDPPPGPLAAEVGREPTPPKNSD